MTKLEEVAAAIEPIVATQARYGCWNSVVFRRSLARAAIEALREPTEEMTKAGFWARDYEGQETDEVYRRMIDAILKDGD